MKVYVDENKDAPVVIKYKKITCFEGLTPTRNAKKHPPNFDSAIFYCPYIPLTTTGVTINPNTLIPTFKTRYNIDPNDI